MNQHITLKNGTPLLLVFSVYLSKITIVNQLKVKPTGQVPKRSINSLSRRSW